MSDEDEYLIRYRSSIVGSAHLVAVYLPGRSAYDIEREMNALYEADVPVIAVEVFDHELADDERGAWVVGYEPPVLAYLRESGCEDYEVQYELRPHGGES